MSPTDDGLQPYADSGREFEARAMALIERRKFTRRDITGGTAILRCDARKVLSPVPWKLIPYRTTGRRPFVRLDTMLMLAICLTESGATPQSVTQDQILMAWTAAGKDAWLRSVVARELRHREALRAMQRDGTLIDGVAARLAEYAR